jgi:hypothetical protein
MLAPASLAVRHVPASALALACALWAAPTLAGDPSAMRPVDLRLPQDAPRHLHKAWIAALQAPLPAAAELSPRGVLPADTRYLNPLGQLGHYQANGPVDVKRNAFFQSLGSNGRSCASCHLPSDGMSISVASLRRLWAATGGRDPVFAPVDGANCPNQVPNGNTRAALLGGRLGGARSLPAASAHSLLLERGLFRVFLPLPKTTADLSPYGGETAHPTEFTLTVVSDPLGCNTDPAYSTVVDPVTQESTRIVSVYRRPRMSANMKYMDRPALSTLGGGPLDNIDFVTGARVVDTATGLPISGNLMWDGREPTLESQARSATLGHAQATTPPTAAQIAEIVAFERAAFSAQAWSWWAGDLTGAGGLYKGQGGPKPLATGTPAFVATGFALYDAWAAGAVDPGAWATTAYRQSIARGQAIFNSRSFTLQGVAGFNNATLLGVTNPTTTTCSSCHGNLGAGSDPLPAGQRAIGIGGGQVSAGGPAPSKALPIFKLSCRAPYRTPFDGTEVLTNDPGLALITGRCADIGRRSVPQLRALAARAPYFSDGSVETLRGVVDFYDARFGLKLDAQGKADLANFLGAL